LSWVAQVGLFFTLGLLVFPSQFGEIWFEAIVLSVVLAAVARPLATLVVTAPFRYSNAERVLLGWAGMRGAVPVVLATFPVIEGVPHGSDFFNIAFFAVLLSTVIQGTTVEPLARRLGMTTSTPALPRQLGDVGTIQAMGAELVEFPVARGDAIAGMHVRDLGLPREALVNVIVRGGRAIPPRGSTRVSVGDVLHIMVAREEMSNMYPLLDRWRKGPMRPAPAREEEVWMTMPVYRARPPDED